jgi:hypothetical protein
MGKKITLTVALLTMCMVYGSGIAMADGCLFKKDARDIYEPQQKAVILYHDGTEEMILSVNYAGYEGELSGQIPPGQEILEEFAWLVPTPQPPQVEEGDFEIFRVMSMLTPSEEPNIKDYLGGRQGFAVSGIDILDERTVGVFDIAVIRASDAAELTDWLRERGFAYDDRAEAVLSFYVERDWCFTAMRVDPVQAEGMEWDLSQGTIDPLRFTFKAPQPIYPLYISSLNPGRTEVLLYVLGGLAYHHHSMKLEYADCWQAVQVGVLDKFSEMAAKMEEDGGCVVTKLRGTYKPEDMEDLYLVPAGAATLQPWESRLAALVIDAGGTGISWKTFLLIALALAFAIAVFFGLLWPRIKGLPWKMLGVFILSALVLSGVLLPIAAWNASGEEEVAGEAGGEAIWPWEKDIIFMESGWKKVVHPDGTRETLGLSDEVKYDIEPESFKRDDERISAPFFANMFVNRDLDDGGEKKWNLQHVREDTSQTIYLLIEDGKGQEIGRIEVGNVAVHDARLSPQGDLLWIALNPGVPVNKTEVREFSFPSLEFRRSIIHPYCMMLGEIIISPREEPVLAGWFSMDQDFYIGLLPMLREGAEFEGSPLVISLSDIQAIPDSKVADIRNSYFCVPLENSYLLLLRGNSYHSGTSSIYVYDSLDGDLHEVGEGVPIDWQ